MECHKAAETVVETAAPVGEYLLFTTKTCPNCVRIKPLLKEAGIAYKELDVAENTDLARNYGLSRAPSMVVVTAEGATVLAGAEKIKEFFKI